jgi:hypothetical protein
MKKIMILSLTFILIIFVSIIFLTQNSNLLPSENSQDKSPQFFISEAISNMNSDYCGKITVGYKGLCYYYLAMLTKNVSQCFYAELSSPNLIRPNQCEMTVRSLIENNPDKCGNNFDLYDTPECLTNFATMQMNPDICKTFAFSTYCYSNLAYLEGNSDLCDNIYENITSDAQSKAMAMNYCIALSTKNPLLCDASGNPQLCFSLIALSERNSTICNMISLGNYTDSLRNDCIDNIKYSIPKEFLLINLYV